MFLSIVGIALVCIPFGFGMYRGSDKVTKVQSDREIHYSEIDSKIDSLLNVKLKQIENERSKSTTKDSSPSAKTTDRETSKRK